jgi:ATP adenylyltransferase/5',5'''-P-1,P-4-tetraphosphate phosphorylase II
MNNKFINLEELNAKSENLSDLCVALLNNQKNTWDLCQKGYSSLESVQVKFFEFDNFFVAVQFNPGRIASSSAKVDPESIKKRKCFLCLENLPENQKGILYRDEFILLCNPFPIFKEHFTIPHIKHIPQSISHNSTFSSFLNLSKELQKKHLVFYNGPKCGASAPDHLHFQAGEKAFFPLYQNFNDLLKDKSEIVFEKNDIEIRFIKNIYRNHFAIISSNLEIAKNYFFKLFSSWQKISEQPSNEEPLINVISWHENNLWIVLFIPRSKHRPACYFAEGNENILLSPASVDIGGICITPVEKDFMKITKDDIIRIYQEVCITDAQANQIIENFSEIEKAAYI